eukprot:GHVN01083407.1.p1 GENE.GHVN01083407.1~~GHVN01083407.1.p1  ORF type:complete len:535 (+),score=60.51 GHVN01083407.1:160-1605(+)
MHASQSANNFSPAPFFSWLSSLLFRSPQHKGQLEFSVEGQVNNFGGRSTTFTPTYKAIMYRVSKIEDDRIWHLRERNLQYYDSQLSTEVNESVYEVMQREPIEVDPGIFVQCEEAQEERPSPNGSGTLVIAVSKIVVFSDTQSAKALKEIIQKWSADYKQYKATQLRDKQLMFIVRFGAKGEEDIIYTDFHSYRHFDNFFFESKDQVMKDIDFFMNEKGWYQKRGLPDSLGILGHGEPGCGKTSFIKALLKHTKRHGVIFSVNHNTSLETIERLMRSDTICDFPVPQSNRVYILEDIDAMGDLVLKRESADDDSTKAVDEGTTESSKLATLGAADKDEKMTKALIRFLGSGFSKKTENHMSFLLNLLDGVIESPGRIVVMTTNHVNKLDPALIRPGRVDIKIHFSKVSRAVLKEILSHFYEYPKEKVNLPECVENGMFTPAVIAQMCRANKHDLDAFLEDLLKTAIGIKDGSVGAGGVDLH